MAGCRWRAAGLMGLLGGGRGDGVVAYRSNMLGRGSDMVTMGEVDMVHGRGTGEMVDSIASVHLNLMAAYIVSYNHPLVNASELVNYLLWEPQRL